MIILFKKLHNCSQTENSNIPHTPHTASDKLYQEVWLLPYSAMHFLIAVTEARLSSLGAAVHPVFSPSYRSLTFCEQTRSLLTRFHMCWRSDGSSLCTTIMFLKKQGSRFNLLFLFFTKPNVLKALCLTGVT